MATSASAADLAARPYTKAPPMAVSPAYNWSGFYIGGNVGYGFGRADEDSSSTLASAVLPPLGPPAAVAPFVFDPVTIPFASSTRTPVDGVLGGGQIGYNAQFGRWVLGIEADIQATDQKRTTSTFTTFGGINVFPPPAIGFTSLTGTQAETVNTRLDWFGTVRGRVGFTTGATGDLMWYGTGGYAYGQFKTSVTQFTAATVATVGTPFTSAGAFSGSQNRSGWTAGGGVEGALWGTAWTWKFEYLHLDFDRANFVFITVPTGTLSSSVVARSARFTDDIIRVGVNYRFNWGGGAVVASY
jgi:outer membrane immunogenic protein